jgi:hypothetical protein
VQVFFGAVEATVVSVNFNQIVVLSPPAFGVGQGNLNQPVDVTVKNINSGTVSNAVTYTYGPAVLITSASNTTQPAGGPFTPVTIFGQGFQAPVAVTLAGVPAFVQSVSATELIVLPSQPLVATCADITGDIVVVNINSGDGATGPAFTYLVTEVVITGISPSDDGGGSVPNVTITGFGFPVNPFNADVKFGSKTAFVQQGSTQGILIVSVPPGSVTTSPACTGTNPPGTLEVAETVDITVTNRETTCSGTSAEAFTYSLPCVVPTP